MSMLRHPLTLLLPMLLLSSLAHAEEASTEYEPYSPYYTGAFVGGGVLLGTGFASSDDLDSDWGSSFGLVGQMSLPLQIFDLQLSWTHNTISAQLDDGDTAELSTDDLSLGIGLHPLFILHLESSPFFYALGGSYLLIGVDAQHIRTELDGDGSSEFDLNYLLGAGFDFPIDDVDDGGALWLGLQYRYNPSTLEAASLKTDIEQHALLLRLTYRKNGLVWIW